MNILYFGTVCDLEKYNNMLKGCASKPSVSTIVFETALLDGLKKNKANVEIYSFPMIPVFPKIRQLYIGEKKGTLPCGYQYTWLRTLNIPVLKQISRNLSARKVLKKWIKSNKDGVILSYSVPPFLAKTIVTYGKKYSVKTVAIVADLLRDMYINENSKSLITKLKKLYIKPALKTQGDFDGYIYLTDAMHDEVAPDKPYTVVEGIADVSGVINQNTDINKNNPPAIMYAGMLHEKYGIINLLDAFEMLENTDAQLWLFGDGTARREVERRTAQNHNIKYFGIVNHDEILEYEKQAALLVNPRNPEDEYTYYSFPSKTIEYMLSGTPLLTSKLRGIPDEYFNYIFSIENNSSAALAEALKNILSYSNEKLNEIGFLARDFIISKKNSGRQAAKLLDFIKEVQNES